VPQIQTPLVSADAARKQAILLGLSLPIGVTLFALLNVFVIRAGVPAEPPDPLLASVWWALLPAGVLAATLIWRLRVVPHLPRGRGRGGPPDAGTLGRLLAGHLAALAALEVPALYGVMLHFMFGWRPALIGGLGVIWIGVLLAWPRRGWFGIR
jgi:hypothetical protein